MHIIKVHTTASTNLFTKELMGSNTQLDNCVIWAAHQSEGKGQRGNVWVAEPGKNLTFSVLMNDLNLPLKNQFVLNMVVSLQLIKFLEALNLQNIHIKWPNDILADKHKICGILIENICQQQTIKKAIIGIGLNVNQQNFEALPQASSLILKTHQNYELEKLLHKFVETFEDTFYELLQKPKRVLQNQYEQYLFRKDKVSTFQLKNKELKTGIIKGINDAGRLRVLLEDETVEQAFDLKELKLLY